MSAHCLSRGYGSLKLLLNPVNVTCHAKSRRRLQALCSQDLDVCRVTPLNIWRRLFIMCLGHQHRRNVEIHISGVEAVGAHRLSFENHPRFFERLFSVGVFFLLPVNQAEYIESGPDSRVSGRKLAGDLDGLLEQFFGARDSPGLCPR